MNSRTNSFVVYGHIVRIPGHPREGKISRVGYTSNLNARNRQHAKDAQQETDKKVGKKGVKSKSGWHFYNAIRKYGYESFEVVVLRRCTTLEDALKWEARLIRKHKTMWENGGYNEIEGGNASPMHDPVVVEKMRKSCSTVWSDPAWRKRQGEKSAQTWANPEFHARHSRKIKEIWRDPTLKKVRGSLSREIWNRPGFRKATSLNMATTWADEKRRKRQSARIQAMWNSRPDLRARKSEQVKQLWLDPDYRARVLAAKSHIYTDPGIRAKHAENTAKAMANPIIKLRTKIGMHKAVLKRRLARAVGNSREAKLARKEASRLKSELANLMAALDRVTAKPPI